MENHGRVLGRMMDGEARFASRKVIQRSVRRTWSSTELWRSRGVTNTGPDNSVLDTSIARPIRLDVKFAFNILEGISCGPSSLRCVSSYVAFLLGFHNRQPRRECRSLKRRPAKIYGGSMRSSTRFIHAVSRIQTMMASGTLTASRVV